MPRVDHGPRQDLQFLWECHQLLLWTSTLWARTLHWFGLSWEKANFSRADLHQSFLSLISIADSLVLLSVTIRFCSLENSHANYQNVFHLRPYTYLNKINSKLLNGIKWNRLNLMTEILKLLQEAPPIPTLLLMANCKWLSQMETPFVTFFFNKYCTVLSQLPPLNLSIKIYSSSWAPLSFCSFFVPLQMLKQLFLE